jgi:TrkA domain protein
MEEVYAVPEDRTRVTEHDLPGIGRRYELSDDSGRPVVVVVHHSGRRDLYVEQAGGTLMCASFTDDQARRLGAILSGALFRPAATARMEALIGGLLMEWVTVRPDSPGAGRSIAELAIRTRTRMTVVAILRGEVPLVSPDPTEVLQAGDQLVVIGHPDDLPGFIITVIG